MNLFSTPAAYSSKHKTKTDSSVLTKIGHIKVINSTPVTRNSHVSYSFAHLCIYQYTNPTGCPHVPGFHQIEVSQYRPPILLNIVGQYLNQIKYRNFMFVSKRHAVQGKARFNRLDVRLSFTAKIKAMTATLTEKCRGLRSNTEYVT